jgi:2-polyprenyl-3-methyl-5-hydroxy-6-metoxy-1,4-benzoquinol methylase
MSPLRGAQQTAHDAGARLADELMALLACPECGGAMRRLNDRLACAGCRRTFPIAHGIPRFVPTHDYADSFGYQWNRFRCEQLDSETGATLSRERLLSETGWDPAWFEGKVLLDAGCGAGRFAEIASDLGAHVVAVDISDAVDAARETLSHRGNVSFVQANLTALPFRRGAFDGIFCIGVIHHTPRPFETIAKLPTFLRRDGRLALTTYERKRYTRFHGKYLVRSLTSRLPPQVLAAAVQASMPALFAFTEVLYRLPTVGKVFRFLIPVANYVEFSSLTLRQRYRWAVLDTFDMLSPRYDKPLTEAEVRGALPTSLSHVRRLPNPGLNIVATRS